MKRLLGNCILLLIATPVFATVQSDIRAKAAREWPRDFHMQEFVIKQQTEAYHQLTHFKAPADVPRDVMQQILEEARSQWPDDYHMQLFVINQQLTSYRHLNAK